MRIAYSVQCHGLKTEGMVYGVDPASKPLGLGEGCFYTDLLLTLDVQRSCGSDDVRIDIDNV